MGRNRTSHHERREIWGLTLIGVCCCAGTSVVFFPGYLSPDSVSQLSQALGETPLADWHPPVLSLLWRALIAVTGAPASMAVLQAVVLWAALAAIAWCVLDATGRRAGALAVLALGLTPHILTFVGVVWKDVHMAFALLAATAVALVALRLPAGNRRLLRWALFAIGVVFIAYAVLVRKNAVLAAIPVFAMLVPAVWPRPRRRTWALSCAALVAALVVPTAAIALFSPPVRTSQYAQIMLDDLVHVVSAEDLRSAQVSPDLKRRLVAAAEKCDRIDSLSDAYWTCYQPSADGLAGDADEITDLWLAEMPGHLSGYLQYRLQVFSKLLFETSYTYQTGVIENDLGVKVARPRLEDTLETYVTGVGRDLPPLFAGWFWLLAALVLAFRPGRGVYATPVRALGVSGAVYVVGYLPIVPTTDYRYVYWSALAVSLGLLLRWFTRSTTTPPAKESAAHTRLSAAVGQR